MNECDISGEESTQQSQLCRTSCSKIILRKRGISQTIVKIIDLKHINRDYAYLQKQLMRQIHSNYVVKIYNLQTTNAEKQLKIEMPYYSNGDLDSYLLNNPKLSFQTKMKMLVDIIYGLMELHTRFIIHRDLKPANIFVDKSGRCVVGDLGIAAVTQSVMRTQIGTFGYQAPQVYSNEMQYDQKIDVWGLGIIAFQLFNPIKHDQLHDQLSFPFNKQITYRNSTGGINYQKYMAYTRNLLSFDISIPFKLSYLIEKMLKNKPQERIDWVQIYSSDILYELSHDQRLAIMKAEYKYVDETRKILREYRQFIDSFMQRKNGRLYQLLILNQYSNHQKDLIQKNWFDFYVYYYLSLKKIAEKHSFFEQKKIYRTILSLKQTMKRVQTTKRYLQTNQISTINAHLLTKGQKQIDRNKVMLHKSYYDQLETKINKLFFNL